MDNEILLCWKGWVTQELQKDKVCKGETWVIERQVKFSIDEWVMHRKSIFDLCSDGL